MNILQLTFTYGNNVGGMLQAYALNRVLTDMGNDCRFLPFFESPFTLQPEKLSAKGRFLRWLRWYKHRNYTNEWFYQFNRFLYDHCQFAEYVPLDQLASIQNDYDMFLVGSDQVWNIPVFQTQHCLLEWVSDKKKRSSYAASLGNYSIRLKNDPVGEAIANFQNISFREELDYEDAKRNGLDCRLDIDPTFLLDQTHWYSLTDDSYTAYENCVALFGYSKDTFEFAKKYAKEHKKKLVIVNYFGNKIFPGIRIVNPSTPLELLSIMRYSACTVTHSYHVFIVSLNLNTPVFYQCKTTAGKTGNRFQTVVNRFGLHGREAIPCNVNQEIDWAAFNRKVAELRDDSLAYLRRITSCD